MEKVIVFDSTNGQSLKGMLMKGKALRYNVKYVTTIEELKELIN